MNRYLLGKSLDAPLPPSTHTHTHTKFNISVINPNDNPEDKLVSVSIIV